MTKKEAAQKLYNILHDDMFSWTQESVDAFNIAIPVLIAQESNTNQHVQRVESVDCISRQAAIDALDEQITQCDKALGSFDISVNDEYAIKVERASLKAYRETLNDLPSAQPERKKGKWHHCEGMYTCDQCGSSLDDISLFCPMCGADMREERRTDGVDR